jgi:Icc-related predicted phosphoesterase
VRILALSDVVDELAIGERADARLRDVDLVVGCGDLLYEYLDYVASTVGAPLVAVHGNHDIPDEREERPEVRALWSAIDLHGRVVRHAGILLGGLGGSRRYNDGPYQYSEAEMVSAILRMLPGLVWSRLRYGRFLDVLVTHAPPRGIHDHEDLCHRGFGVFRAFLRVFRPRFHLHGHCHVYDRRTVVSTRFHNTLVLNAFGHRVVELTDG